jgi:hypothetical protein
MTPNQSSEDLTVWLWLYVPFLILISIFVINVCFSSVGVEVDNFVNGQNYGPFYYINDYKYFYKNLADFLINHENGLVETGTVIILIPAIYYGVLIFKTRKLLPVIYLTPWYFIITLACFYFAGEEISWGQHLIGWDTPESIKEINDQGETNIHNMSSWFDQKPRLILELSILFGGIIIPILVKLFGYTFNNNKILYWIIPTIKLVPIALITISIKGLDRFQYFNYKHYEDGASLTLFQDIYFSLFYGIRLNEVQELFFAYFLMLYLLLNYKRIKNIKLS